ncbi:MAG: dipeptide epimerase [Gammaproteobacteria bacterium]|nr:dipeptide epimerase [Gammaproteobacteria bacterium]MDH3905837.1 dipeptide epimerase [Gammaproteobacteria bacterium]MDH3982635.1 dipeptide epimerase [Gammaproteobacteria bacterium]
MRRNITIRMESWPAIIPFRISNHVWDDFPCVVCEIEQGGLLGRGEALGVYYLDETTDSMAAELEAIIPELETGADQQRLLELLPPGGARMAADAALWDLETQITGRSAWSKAGVGEEPIETVFTIGLEDTPEAMAAKAAAAADISLFKVKLGADRPVERITAIREARPDARMVVDINQGWTFDELQQHAPALQALGVSMIEQPLPRGGDSDLEGYEPPLPLCGDESCLHLGELEDAARRYQMINIKLDKTGGLTHGLELAHAAREKGLRLMVGCMGGTSLAMAPHHVIAQLCDFVDIDGPLLIKEDRPGGLHYDKGIVTLPERPFWGQPGR